MSILERKESIWLELDGESPFFPIKAQQGDKNTLVVEILLLYKKQPYQIPEGVIPRIMYKKPDGHQVLKDCDISAEGKVVVRYTDQMLSTPGTGKANILLISDGEELKTPPFFTKIWPAAYGTEIPKSSDEYITIEQILTQCDDKVKTAQEYAVFSDISANDSRESAKAAADSAEAAKGYYEQLQSEQVTGIKGSSEENFRTGQVTISAEDVGAVAKQGDTAENIVTFESNDSEDVNEWTSVEVLASKEKHNSIIAKLSRMFKNIRYLYPHPLYSLLAYPYRVSFL